MNYISEAASGFVIVIAAIGGALIVLPRAKPEPPPMPVVLELPPKPVERAEPVPAKSDAERVDDLQRQLVEIAAEQERLTEDVRDLAKQKRSPAKVRDVEKVK